jgi:hypothetical protein
MEFTLSCIGIILAILFIQWIEDRAREDGRRDERYERELEEKYNKGGQ